MLWLIVIGFYLMIKKKVEPMNLKQTYETYIDVVRKYSKMFNVPDEIIIGLIHRESSGVPYAIGRDGEIGLTQLTKYSLSDFNSNNFYDKLTLSDLFDIDNNIKVSTWYLSFLHNRFYGGDWFTTLRAYNAGIGRIKQDNNISIDYAKSILEKAETIKTF